MIQVIVISHGDCCHGLIDTLKMVSGDDYGVRALSLAPGVSPEEFRAQLSRQLDECRSIDRRGTLVLADIAGGTPFNSAMYLRGSYEMGIVSGANVPMLMTIAIERSEDDTLDTLLEKATAPLAIGVRAVHPGAVERGHRAKLSAHQDR